jgi:leucyl aminopeptidase
VLGPCELAQGLGSGGDPAAMPFESRLDRRNRKIHTAKDTIETSGNNDKHAVKLKRLAAE